MPATLTPEQSVSAQTANYFITLCTHERQCLFGQIVEGQMDLSALGAVVEAEWQIATAERSDIDCEQWVIMPNHMHGIVTLAEPAAETHTSARQQQHVLDDWLDQFKAEVTEHLHSCELAPSSPVWQPTNDQQRIPHHFAFHTFRQYIRSNPHSWLWDKLHPDSPSDWLYSENAA